MPPWTKLKEAPVASFRAESYNCGNQKSEAKYARAQWAWTNYPLAQHSHRSQSNMSEKYKMYQIRD